MSSSASAPFIVLDLVPSRILILGLGIFHLLAFLSLFFISLSLWIILPLGIGLILSFFWYYWRYGNPRNSQFIEQVRLMPDRTWIIRTAHGEEKTVRLIGSYVHPSLLILNFSLGRFKRRSVVVLPDAADRNEVRRLRVWLRAQHGEEL